MTVYLHTAFVLLVLSLSPALLWLYVYYRRDSIQPEPKKLIAKTFIYGMLVALPLLGVQYINRFHPDLGLWNVTNNLIGNSILAASVFYLLVAYVEEYLKHIGMVMIVERHRSDFDQIVDGIEYAVASALGFVFVENLIYFWAAQQQLELSSKFLAVFAVRAIVSTLAHTVFSGYFGYFYAKARLDKSIVAKTPSKLTAFHKELWHGAWKLHVTRSHLLPERPSHSKHPASFIIAEGFVIAIGMHFAYNVLMKSSFSYLVIPLLFLAGYYLFLQFYCKGNHHIVKRTSSKFVRNVLCWPEKRRFIKEYGRKEEEWKELFVKR